MFFLFFFFKQKTAYEIYQCDWSSDVCSSDLNEADYDKIDQGDKLTLETQSLVPDELVLVNETKGIKIQVRHELAERDKDVVKAGGKLGYARKSI